MGPASPPDWASTVNGPRERGSFVPLPRQVSVIGRLNTVACCTAITAMSRSTKSSPAIRLVRRRYCCRMRVRHAARTLRIHPTLAIFLPPKHLKSRRSPLRIQFFLDLFYSYFRHHSVFQQKKPFPGQKRNQGFRRILNLNFDFFVLYKRYP
mgnify:CR=1 FL=1